MKSKWLAALAFLFLAAAACICGSTDGELADAVSDLADASIELREAVDSALVTDDDLADEFETQEEIGIQAEIEVVKSEPEMYTCDYINDQRKKMTELQWDEYTKSLVGKPIAYEGTITEVYDDARIQVKACTGVLTGGPFVIYGTPKETAVSFSKGQYVKGEGTIREVGTFIVMYIHVNGETIE